MQRSIRDISHSQPHESLCINRGGPSILSQPFREATGREDIVLDGVSVVNDPLSCATAISNRDRVVRSDSQREPGARSSFSPVNGGRHQNALRSSVVEFQGALHSGTIGTPMVCTPNARDHVSLVDPSAATRSRVLKASQLRIARSGNLVM